MRTLILMMILMTGVPTMAQAAITLTAEAKDVGTIHHGSRYQVHLHVTSDVEALDITAFAIQISGIQDVSGQVQVSDPFDLSHYYPEDEITQLVWFTPPQLPFDIWFELRYILPPYHSPALDRGPEFQALLREGVNGPIQQSEPLFFSEYDIVHSQRYYSADINHDQSVDIDELMRIVQYYNSDSFDCQSGSEDGFGIPSVGTENYLCPPHDSDNQPQDWRIDLIELLRVIQIYNSTQETNLLRYCECGEDGFFIYFY
ncbi:MAG: hypothetical protein KBB55_03215 [Candidatus Buchananbacteria bacterium]|nr:hypothetical protein [Candidatus Buchananbacteria bacterium]